MKVTEIQSDSRDKVLAKMNKGVDSHHGFSGGKAGFEKFISLAAGHCVT